MALARGGSGFAIVDDLITRAHAALMADADDGVIAVPARYAIGYRTLAADVTRPG